MQKPRGINLNKFEHMYVYYMRSCNKISKLVEEMDVFTRDFTDIIKNVFYSDFIKCF